MKLKSRLVSGLLAAATCSAVAAPVTIDYAAIGNAVNVSSIDPNVHISLSGAPGGNVDAYAFNNIGITDSSKPGEAFIQPNSGNMLFDFQGTVTSLSFNVNWEGSNPVTGYGVTYADNFYQWVSNVNGGLISVSSNATHGAIADLLVSNGCNGVNVGQCYTAAGTNGNWIYNVLSLSYDGFSAEAADVPEPASLALLGLGLAGLAFARRKSA